jgi:DNA-binding transcriptional LysR family regulator
MHRTIGSKVTTEVELSDIAVFVKVVETGGFSAAARARHEPKSSVSRRVARLERSLGTRLLHRTTRSVALTEAGATYFKRAARALTDLDEAAGAALAAQEEPRGTIRMTAPPDVGNELLPFLLTEFVALYPHVHVETDLSADTPNLVEGGFDIALRGSRGNDEALATTKLQDTAFRLYAAPRYLERFAAPDGPAGLADHMCVLFRGRGGKCIWQLRSGTEEVDVAVTGAISANDLSFVRRAAVAGAGIALLPELVGAESVAAGELVPVLSGWSAGGAPLFLVYPSRQHLPLRIRALRDHFLARFPDSLSGGVTGVGR